VTPTRPAEQLVNGIEGLEALDQLGQPIGSRVRAMVPSGAVKDALSGTWLGHAVHPMLTDVVIGSFLGTTLLDLFAPGQADVATRRLLWLGIAAYGPTALTGVNDWADTEAADSRVRRAGLVHAASNAVALTLYTSSLVARRRGRRGTGVALGLAGATALMVGGYLGGHLSLRRGVGPDQTVFDPGPDEWTRAAEAGALRPGELSRVLVDDTPLVVGRSGGDLFALHDRCSHRGCSLSQGELDGEEVVCSCHGSRFDRRTGAVRRGPATAPQPAFEVRERDGAIEVRRRG
jgi:nitrite reductase/ring-hydroxylating ferredoxin subunit/uncharacterized membrane protein